MIVYRTTMFGTTEESFMFSPQIFTDLKTGYGQHLVFLNGYDVTALSYAYEIMIDI